MFYDLNVPFTHNDPNLPRTLAFLHELGYNVVALNHSITGKLPTNPTCAIPDPLFPAPPPTISTLPTTNPPVPPQLRILRRLTLTLTEPHQNARLTALSRPYDLLALRPTDERTLQLACGSLDCDIIMLDLTQRFPFYFKHKMLAEATRAGKRIEICYAAGVVAGVGGEAARRNLIANATQLIRATRGRGMLVSSGANSAAACRGPWDVVNLMAVWGLGQERGYEALSKEARNVVVSAGLKRSGYKGVVDVVYGGEKVVEEKEVARKVKGVQVNKRKAEVLEKDVNSGVVGEKQISKREAKRRARQARLDEGGLGGLDTASGGQPDAGKSQPAKHISTG